MWGLCGNLTFINTNVCFHPPVMVFDTIYFILLYPVNFKVDCFQSWACWGDNEHAEETVWIPNIKFIYLLPDVASVWSKRIVMSSDLSYENVQTCTEQIRSKETINKLPRSKTLMHSKEGLARRVQWMGFIMTHTHTHREIHTVSSMSCAEWVLHNGYCTL